MQQSDRFTGNCRRLRSGGRCTWRCTGIYSARYSGEDATDQKNLQKLLETMKDVPDDQRQARFHCVLVYLRHAEDPTPLVCHGSWPGVITREPAGTGGFGYDPIFFVPSEGKPLPN